MPICGLSPGTGLIAGSTGWQYEVRRLSRTAVIVDGPHGLFSVSRDELEKGIASGKVKVL